MTTLQNDRESDLLVVDDEVFYESLDRIVSSSNSSTSNSEDEAPHCGVRHRNNGLHNSSCVKPSSVMPLNSYDVWTSNESFSCSSLEQRRDRLLFALGLGSDSCFSRRKSSSCRGFDESSSFVSCDLVCNATSNEVMTRSKSENSFKSSSFSSIHSVPDTLNVNSCDSNNNNDGMCNVDGDGNENNCDSNVVDDKVNDNDNDGDMEGTGCVDSSENVDRVCTIKNLDTGKEFVVNEMSENGTWGELKEVGTGRRLTMKEFEMSFGHSPIVQELMRRQNVEHRLNNNSDNCKGNVDLNENGNIGNGDNGSMAKKKVSWLKNIKKVAGSVAGYSSKERRSSDDKDTSSDRGGRRSSSATDDSQDGSFNGPERVRVRQYGKSVKELSALYKSQEIKAHNGSIWAIKFSLDGMYLASAGEDRVIHVWQVVESERKGELLMDRSDDLGLNLFLSTNGLAEPNSVALIVESRYERRRSRSSTSRKSLNLEHIMVPGSVFGLSEKPFCSFQGHSDDVLDLSWSRSKLLLSSSMDKTVRLWNLSSKTCLKTFSHSDYVTCIQFNPVDDRYFISGSLDAKVRIWSIPDRQVVDWNDLHEMVTAACYTPDGQGALVGSYKGRCRLYNTSENKLQQKCLINLHNNKKKTHLKKITGFQFAPGSSSEVLITSADSRIRLVDDGDLVHKFKGFRNTNSQISGSLTANGKYVVCASEDSQVYVWKLEGGTNPTTRTKGVTVTSSYEHFHCQDATIAIPWPGFCETWESRDPSHNGSHHPHLDDPSSPNHPPTPVELGGFGNPPFRGTVSSAPSSYFFDRISATWPEEELLRATNKRSPCVSWDFSNGVMQNRSAWGMVIVTAGLRGEIRTFQNFGLPVRI